jgi:hypothetical protein
MFISLVYQTSNKLSLQATLFIGRLMRSMEGTESTVDQTDQTEDTGQTKPNLLWRSSPETWELSSD